MDSTLVLNQKYHWLFRLLCMFWTFMACLFVPLGLLLTLSGEWKGGLFLGMALFLLVWTTRHAFQPTELSPTLIKGRFLFWNKEIRVKDILKIRIVPYDWLTNFYTSSVEAESISLHMRTGFFKRHVLHVLKSDGIGDYLRQHLELSKLED